jgi:hypothetical protein
MGYTALKPGKESSNEVFYPECTPIYQWLMIVSSFTGYIHEANQGLSMGSMR